jgi:D-amino-acid oxidase
MPPSSPTSASLDGQRVAVLGDGVVGLNTALVAAGAGAEVTLYSASNGDAMELLAASDKACALWYPLLVEGDQVRIGRWCHASYGIYEQRFRDGHRGIERVRNIEILDRGDEYHDVPDGIRSLPGFSMATISSAALRGDAYGRWTFNTFVISMQTHLCDLRERVRAAGCRFVRAAFHDQDDIWATVADSVVFNCLGMGSRRLFDDDALVPKKGHLLFFDPVNLDVAIGRYDVALIPRRDALVCGTLFLDDHTVMQVGADERTRILDEVRSWVEEDLFDIGLGSLRLDESRIRGERTGLRPLRLGGVRLEAERVAGRLVIHDYGHGGSGVTVAPGCAEEAVALAAAELVCK